MTSMNPCLIICDGPAHNRKISQHTGQDALFVNFNFLLNHARCVLHEEYLPYEDATNTAPEHIHPQETHKDTQDRQDLIISICTSSSEAILDIMSELANTDDRGRETLQSVFAAGALLSAANIQLWHQYVQGKDSETRTRAASRLDEIASVFESWEIRWPITDAWSSTLVSLRRLYQATYTPTLSPQSGRQVDDAETNASAPPALIESDVYERPYPHLTEGNGLPLLNERMSDKIRFILLASLEDANARDRVLNSSLATLGQHTWEYEGFPEDFDFAFPELYADDSWSSFIGDDTIGTSAIQGLHPEHDIATMGPA